MKIVAAAAFAASLAVPAWAQTVCSPREMVIDKLVGNYGETVQVVGLGTDGVFVEVWANDETGTWTIVVTRVDGLACPIASGHSYESISPTGPKGDPA